MMDLTTTGEKWIDVGAFGWLVRYECSDIWMDFHAYEAISRDDNGTRFYERMGGMGGLDMVDDPDEAESISGYVKWDGCSHYDLGDRHFCGREDVEEFGDVLLAIHGIAAEVLTGFDRECAGYAPELAS